LRLLIGGAPHKDQLRFADTYHELSCQREKRLSDHGNMWKTIDETVDACVPPFLLWSAAAGLPKWRRLIVRLLLKVYGIAVAVCLSGKILN